MYDWIRKVSTKEGKWGQWVRLVTLIPRPVVLAFCLTAAYAAGWLTASGLRAKVHANMRDLLGPCTLRKLKAYSQRYLLNVILVLYEILVESSRLQGSEKWRFRVEGEQHLAEALELGRGAIVYTPHTGNFFYYYWYLCQTYDCLTVATASSSELRPLYMRFADLGCRGMDYDSTPPLQLMRRLRSHLQQGGVVFLLGDFWRPTFPAAQFFGRSTRTPEGAATLSIEGGVPVVPFAGWREKGFVHRLRFEAPLHLASSFNRSSRKEAAAFLNGYMERVIRERPQEWFYWFNAEERWEAGEEASAQVPEGGTTTTA
ncbi:MULTISPECIES: lysophospholipid acyltransferase family protein [Paenibacillus]|uniref:lysophospholipid acyltransferase family protein n=1 Tax=Paenibacillus TaxID=44249 RepID=UPI0022B8E203|nr:lysophospholipid acyltransferase family protein [Paenibacillus caseinilyticus]MCZ8521496.1 lysophospholipid acyltransferase family protein [Paenibacillus caseinilyticus]